VLENANHARYLDSGHLLFSRDGVLLVAPFDPATERVGDPVPLPLRVKVDNRNQANPMPQLAVSRNGTLAYVPMSEAAGRECTLSWMGASGKPAAARHAGGGHARAAAFSRRQAAGGLQSKRLDRPLRGAAPGHDDDHLRRRRRPDAWPLPPAAIPHPIRSRRTAGI
jgi:hypothetical protein